jgi:pyrroline-5-carboxylate reductase
MATLTFVGGGNMARAIVGGLVRGGWPSDVITVVEPNVQLREGLERDFGVATRASADASLPPSKTVVWAVKPQIFGQAAAVSAAWSNSLHISVMAGVRSLTIASATKSPRVIRAMPNTPALIGQGISGLFASADTTEADRAKAEAVLAPTGRLLWFGEESQLDAVTAVSGSGPAYVFYLVEAMERAAKGMGLSAEQGRELALHTFAGAAALALQSGDAPSVLRERVTSKGGTTAAALAELDRLGVGAAFKQALRAAQQRAVELGQEAVATTPPDQA